MSLSSGLYIVATPIGNLKDISIRALECLRDVDLIVCEDTRTTAHLLQHYRIKKPLISLHLHNEKIRLQPILNKLSEGLSIALVSDAGTPVIHDPGYLLVQACQEANFLVVSVPGPCAAITALTLSGISGDQFLFGGFLPARAAQRKKKLEEYLCIPITLILYEAPHRIKLLLETLMECDLSDRQLIILRELTKKWETHYFGSPESLLRKINEEGLLCKGEFVIIISAPMRLGGKQEDKKVLQQNLMTRYEPLLCLMVQYKISLNQASSVIAECSGLPKKQIYSYLLKILKQEDFDPLN